MEEYKGLYYGDQTERNFFEAGAHFKYIELYKILEKIAEERKLIEIVKEFFVHKKNSLTNNFHKKLPKDKTTRNIINNFNKNKKYNNTLLAINNRNDSVKYNHHQTYSSINNNIKNKVNNNFLIKNQKKMIVSRNKDNLLFKGLPNTFLKDEIQTILFIQKNCLMSASMEQKNNKKNFFAATNLKRSLPDLNKKINDYFKQKKLILYNIGNNYNIKSNNKDYISINGISSFIEVNKIGLKTERLNTTDEQKVKNGNITEILENKNKSHKNFDKVCYTNGFGVNKNIKNKNMNFIENIKRNKERTKSNISSDINRKILKQLCNIKKDIKNIDKKEIPINKTKKKSNIKQNFIMHNNNFSKINFNNKSNIINQNKIEKMKTHTNFSNTNNKFNNKKKIDKNILNKINLNQSSFKKIIRKLKNVNGINSPFNLTNSFTQKESLLNSTRNKYDHKFKKNFNTITQMKKLPKQVIQNQNNIKNKDFKNSLNNKKYYKNTFTLMNKSTPKIIKKIKTNSSSVSNKTKENMKSKLIIKPYTQIKVNNNNFKSIINKINNSKLERSLYNNTISEFKNKISNNQVMNNTGIYIQPKQFLYYLRKNKLNDSNVIMNNIKNNIISLNYTQRTHVRKKKAIIKFIKK